MSEINSKISINSDNDEISLRELIIKIKEWLLYLKSKSKLIILVSVVGAILGLTYSKFKKPSYKAILTFALEEEKGNGGGLSGALGFASSIGIDIGGGAGGAFSGANLIALMKSRLLIEKTLLNPVTINNETISIAEYYIRLQNLREKWRNNKNINEIKFSPNDDRLLFTKQKDSILQTLFNALSNKNKLIIIQKDKKATITTLEVINEDENFAKVFCESLIKETSNYYIETKSKKARLNFEILQKQVDSIRAELNLAITGVASAADNVYNLNPAYIVKQSPSKMRQIDVQTNSAVLAQLIPQLEMSKVTLLKETPLIQIIDKPILPLEANKIGNLQAILLCGLFGGFITSLYLVLSQMLKNLLQN